MSKYELIEAIREYNPSATMTFLSQFDTRDLEEYRDHLEAVLGELPAPYPDTSLN